MTVATASWDALNGGDGCDGDRGLAEWRCAAAVAGAESADAGAGEREGEGEGEGESGGRFRLLGRSLLRTGCGEAEGCPVFAFEALPCAAPASVAN